MPLRDLREVIMPTTRFILRVKQACKDRHLVTVLTDDSVMNTFKRYVKRWKSD